VINFASACLWQQSAFGGYK